jgi:raffinose/stachyose/melibiose transport system permease protein
MAGFGYSTLLFAISIQKIPRDLYDAAIMDGAEPGDACGASPFR